MARPDRRLVGGVAGASRAPTASHAAPTPAAPRQDAPKVTPQPLEQVGGRLEDV